MNNNTPRELEYNVFKDKVVKISAIQLDNSQKFYIHVNYYFIDGELFAAHINKAPVAEKHYFKNEEPIFYVRVDENKAIDGEYKNCRICLLEAKELLKKTKKYRD